jgi:glycosyltransferase involved in cell wall biosynthesis
MRIAWFSPLPPARSGIATYSADLVPRLAPAHAIDAFTETNARDFVWKARRDPYDLVVYQLGNAPCHDYMWGYLAAFPGLVVLHDARLHQARARALLQDERFDDYRREFCYDHPEARRDFAEYAIAGLGGPIYYCWPMLRVVIQTARLVAVHNPRVAADLRDQFPGTPVEAIHLGTAPIAADAAARGRARAALGVPADALLFAAFGKITAEKRIDAIVRAFDAIARERADVHLLLAGDDSDAPALAPSARRVAARRACTSPATSRTRRSPATSPPPTRACACDGRPRSKHRRRGCSASPPRVRPRSAISRTWSTSRRSPCASI